MKNQKIVILGATGAVGRELSKRLAVDGSTIIAGVRDRAKAESLEELSGAHISEVDATSWESVGDLFKRTISEHGGIDGVAVCVGSILLKPAHLTSPEEFEAVMRQNLVPCFATLRSCARGMMKTGGSIVFVSSAAARHGFPSHEAIASAKAGIIGLTLSAAATYATNGIRVNCVAPGLVDSEMARPITQNEMSLKASEGMHALGRIGSPKDVASAIAWLLDTEQSWVTGQTLGVDGGLSALFSRKR